MTTQVVYRFDTYNVEIWSIREIIRCINSPTEKIQVMPPEFQRDFVASLKWKQHMINSFYYGLSSNLIHFRKLGKKKSAKIGFAYQCLDGLQRLSTMLEFAENEICDKEGRYFKDLSIELQNKFLDYTFTVYVYHETMTDQQAGETFCRINNANDLNDQEKINAIPGYVSQIIRNQARLGPVLPIFETQLCDDKKRRSVVGLGMLPGVRLKYDAVLARWYTIEYDKQTNATKKAFYGAGINLPHTQKMYNDPKMKSQYDANGEAIYLNNYTWPQPKLFAPIEKEVVRRAKFVYDCMIADTESNKKVFNTDGKIHVLYDITYFLDDHFGKNCVKDFKKFVRGIKKVLVENLDQSVSKDSGLAFQRLLACGTGHEIISKIDVFLNEIHADPEAFGIVEMDHSKISDSEKMKLWSAQDYKCWIDEEEADIGELEAAHILARSLGGKNVLDNYVLVRKQYNRNMGTMTPQAYKQHYFEHLCPLVVERYKR